MDTRTFRPPLARYGLPDRCLGRRRGSVDRDASRHAGRHGYQGPSHATAFEPYVKKIAENTLAFGKPVLLINGDSHVYRSDTPLSPSDPVYSWHPGYDVPNFHRIVVHGSTFPLEWLKLTVTPGSNAPNGSDAFGPFSWARQIQQ